MVAGFSNLVLMPHFVQENRITCLCSEVTLQSFLFEIFSYRFEHLEKKRLYFFSHKHNEFESDLFQS